jgi:methylated-DNA-protein-cysteine methyltransferase-like protein
VGGTAAVESIWRVVAAIPAGRVSTYGDVARLAGLPRGARQVGHALGKAPATLKLPWYRVIGAGGRIALPKDSAGYRTQIRKLEAEGIKVVNGRVRLPEFQWAADLDELIWGPP